MIELLERLLHQKRKGRGENLDARTEAKVWWVSAHLAIIATTVLYGGDIDWFTVFTVAILLISCAVGLLGD
jgi:hypothetical protein